ncbi:MAG: TetR/AcrR family transcriptional regulator [Chloroflexota bacterium]
MTDVEGRREQILRAAVEVFGERGYNSATISDIANAAGVAHGTVYLYFRSKAEILQSLHASFAEWLTGDLSGPDGVDLGDTEFGADLYRMFRGALAVCSRHLQITEVCLREHAVGDSDLAAGFQSVEGGLVERVSERVARAIADGEARPARPEFAGAVVVRLLGVAIRRLLALGADADVDLLAREMVDFIMHGLAPDRPRDFPAAERAPLSEDARSPRR